LNKNWALCGCGVLSQYIIEEISLGSHTNETGVATWLLAVGRSITVTGPTSSRLPGKGLWPDVPPTLYSSVPPHAGALSQF